MADSTLGMDMEKSLMGFCAIVNKLTRIGVLTTTLVSNTTTVATLISDAYAALLVSTEQKYPASVRILVRLFEQYVRLMEDLGLLDTTIVGLLQTCNTVDASTDLRYLASSKITLNGFDATSEADPNITKNFSFATTG